MIQALRWLRTKAGLGILMSIALFWLTPGIVYAQKSQPRLGILKQAGRSNNKLVRIRKAIRTHMLHGARLMDTYGVVATGTGIRPDGEPVIVVLSSAPDMTRLPPLLEDIPVEVSFTNRFYALSDPLPSQYWPRPGIPIGVSTGHPLITAGTIGARLTLGAAPPFYALSNNHVYAAINAATPGDNVLQPGIFDGGVDPRDAIGVLHDFEEIEFCSYFWFWLNCPQTNTMDAAIAHIGSTPEGEPLVANATPSDGYGTPGIDLHPAYGDPYEIGDEDLAQLLAAGVQKYGRTTGLTTGTIEVVNATVDVCYDNACSKVARFVDQLIITPGSFSSGGDSGSLIVTNDADKQPVALLFAGSDTNAIANRIDLVLNRFGAAIDGRPPEPLTEITLVDIAVPKEIIPGETVSVVVTVENTGNQIIDSFNVSLTDMTSGSEIGRQPAENLAAGAVESLHFVWDTTGSALGEHTLFAIHDLYDNPGLETTVKFLIDKELKIEYGTVWATSASWTPVSLQNNYGDQMVVVCTPNYNKDFRGSAKVPLVAHVRNASGDGFELRLVQAVPWTNIVSGAEVHWMVVKEGVYNREDHGLKMEAIKLVSSITDRYDSWVGEKRSYAQPYTNPVVLGQVMSLNSYDQVQAFDLWSAFWCRGASRGYPPSPAALYVGKHSGEDARTRDDEIIGYIVVEAGAGTFDSFGGTPVTYQAYLGPMTVKGVGDAPPYQYVTPNAIDNFRDAVAILSQAAMRGTNGGWAMLYGDYPVVLDGVRMAIDEDQVTDSERNHVEERVGYIIFE